MREKYYGLRGEDLRRRPRSKRRTFEVQRMWEVHHEIARLLSLGMKATEIARGLGVSSAMVNYTKSSRIVQDKVAILRGARDAESIDLAKRIRDFAPKCLDLLENVIAGRVKDAGIGLRVSTAKDYADRAGLAAVRKHQVLSAHLTKDQLEEIKQRARDAGIIKDNSRQRLEEAENVTPAVEVTQSQSQSYACKQEEVSDGAEG